MSVEGDTIAAIATAAGVGGVGIVRLSGPRALEISAAITGRALDRSVRLAWACDPDGVRIDQVLAFAMRAPHSFTGEDVAELHGHGGTHNLERLLAAVVARGARIAEPGEFTRRAVLNGKLDLVRAEALLEVIHAGSERALRLAQQNLGGKLGEVAAQLETRVLRVLGEIEGRIDFPDDDLGPEEARVLDAELTAIANRCTELAAGFRHGRAVQHGVTIALVGPVNVGKSSLLNALLGKERALVAAAPGTTRDYLEVSDVWDGVAVTIVDTAGTRTTTDPVEARGIELGEQRVAAADVIVVVNDAMAPWDDGARYGERALVVRSKADLASSKVARDAVGASVSVNAVGASVSGNAVGASVSVNAVGASVSGNAVGASVSGNAVGASVSGNAVGASVSGKALTDSKAALATSAVTGAGLVELRTRALAIAGVTDREGNEDAFVTTARQHAVTIAARDALNAAVAARRSNAVAEVVALELRQAAAALAQLRGTEVGDRVLDEVFARFCIGK